MKAGNYINAMYIYAYVHTLLWLKLCHHYQLQCQGEVYACIDEKPWACDW